MSLETALEEQKLKTYSEEANKTNLENLLKLAQQENNNLIQQIEVHQHLEQERTLKISSALGKYMHTYIYIYALYIPVRVII